MPGPFGKRLRSFFASPVETKSTSGVASPDAWLVELFGASPAASGVSVTPHSAMRCAAVRCAVQAIAEAIGQLPVHVYTRGDNDARERDRDHPAYRLLHDEVNDWTSASDLREQLTRDALLHGNGLAFVNRVEGRPVELLRLAPETVTIKAAADTGEPVYLVAQAQGSPRALARADVLHLKAPSLDGLKGESPVIQAREAIGLALVMEAHAARLFGNGARPSGVITVPGALPPEANQRLRTAWQNANAGAQSGGTSVLDHGASWLPLTFNSVDAQFLELRRFAIEEVARAFRVPPMMLMDYGRATWANSEEMGRQFLTYTLLPWIKRWEGEIRLKLISPDERENTFAEFLTDDLLRADYSKRMQGYAQAIAARVLNPNEARAAENRAPYTGGDVFANPNTTPARAPAHD